MSALWLALPFVALAVAVPLAVWWERRERARQYVTVEIVVDLKSYAEAMDEVRRAFDDLKREVGLSFLPAMAKLVQALDSDGDQERKP